MKKIALILVALIVKIFATMILGLLFTHDFAGYTRYVSRTNDLVTGFVLFVLLIDFLTILIVTNIAKAFFEDVKSREASKVSKKIKTYIIYSIIAIAIFWLTDVMFIIEIKSHKTIHHIFTGILLMDKYVIFLLISTAYILQIHKIQPGDKARLFLNYQSFKFKSMIGEKIFTYSKIFYNTRIALCVYLLMMLYIDILTLFLYSKTIIFLLNVIVCGAILFYLILIVLHQLNVILSTYKTYTNKEQEP